MSRRVLRSQSKVVEVVPETPPPTDLTNNSTSLKNISNPKYTESSSSSRQLRSTSPVQYSTPSTSRSHTSNPRISTLNSDPFEDIGEKENPLEFLEKMGDYREVVTSTPKSTLDGSLPHTSPISPFLQDLSDSIETPVGYERPSFQRKNELDIIERSISTKYSPTSRMRKETQISPSSKEKGKKREIVTTEVLRLRPGALSQSPALEAAQGGSSERLEEYPEEVVVQEVVNKQPSVESPEIGTEEDPFGFAKVEKLLVRTRQQRTPPARKPLTPVRPTTLNNSNIRNIREASPAFRLHTPKVSDLSEDSEKENLEPYIVIDRPPSKRPLTPLKQALRSNRKKATVIKDFTTLLPKRRHKHTTDEGDENAPPRRQRKTRKAGNPPPQDSVASSRSRTAEKGKYVPGRRRLQIQPEELENDSDESVKRRKDYFKEVDAYQLEEELVI